MLTLTDPRALFLAIPLAALTLIVWRRGAGRLSPRRSAAALVVRLALIAAMLLALAGISLRLPQSRQAVTFVADLSASDASAQSHVRLLIDSALKLAPADAQAGIVAVGRDALVEQRMSRPARLHRFNAPVNSDYTNLEGGLQLGGALLPDGYRQRVVLLSDGQQNVGDALSAARLLRSRHVRLDVVPLSVPRTPEVLVDRVDVPAQLRLQESFSLKVSVRANISTTTQLQVYRDQTLLSRHVERLHPGDNAFVFPQHPLHPGFHTYSVRISPARDTSRRNNSGAAFTLVQGPTRVLVIAADAKKAANIVASLRATGIKTDLATPRRVPHTLDYLRRYGSVVLVDTSAQDLGIALMQQLVPYVRNLGRGLLVTGGDQSYGLGGYGGTPLEGALPVTVGLPKRKDLPSVAVVLIIESLEADNPINISKEAGKATIALLTPQDQVAVDDAPDDGSTGWAVRLQYVKNKAAIDRAIDAMDPGDPPTYSPYLQDAFNVLKRAQARVKHIILLGDGDANLDDYGNLVKRIHASGITVSTIATPDLLFGADPDNFRLMQNIARLGGGRFYKALKVSTVPRLFLREARVIGRSAIQQGRFYPREVSANPMLRGLPSVPPLNGYVVTRAKPAGEVVLASKKNDPVLAGWQFGLGRVAAWTSDAAGRWTADWLRTPGANRVWANLVSWTLPAANAGSLFLSASSQGGQGTVSVAIPSSLGATPSVTARVVDPALHVTTVPMQASTPGRYVGSFGAGRAGAYLVSVEARGAGSSQVGQAGLTVPFSDEYRTTGTNLSFLRALAGAGGGKLIDSPRMMWADNLAPVFGQRDLSDLLWLLALLLLPLDIAVRRLPAVSGRSSRG